MMPKRNPLLRNLLLATACVSALAACSAGGNVRETLGLSRTAPDEFRVYARPPLTVPPEFALRAPGSQSSAQGLIPANEQARNAVLGASDSPAKADTAVGKVSSRDLSSNADAQFLQHAGADRAVDGIRSQIQQEGGVPLTAKDERYLVNSQAGGEPTVDAKKEAARLKENKDKNKSPTEGETPVVQPKSKGILGTLGDIF